MSRGRCSTGTADNGADHAAAAAADGSWSGYGCGRLDGRARITAAVANSLLNTGTALVVNDSAVVFAMSWAC